MIREFFQRRRAPSSADILREMLGELEDLQRSRRHIKALGADLRPFVQKFPRLEAISDKEVTVYLCERAAKVGPRRRDNILGAIVQLSRFARRRNHLPEDRRSAAEKVKKIRPGHDVATWTAAEAKLLLEHVSRHWLPCMALGLFAGLRTSEILRLDWSAVKFDQGVIAVSRKVARKSRISRLAPISDNLLAWLQPYRDRVGQIYHGDFKTNENARSWQMARIRLLTGLPRKDNANRHSFGSHRLALVKNFEQVAVEMGNSPRMVRESYNDPKSSAEGVAYFGLMPPSFDNVIHLPLPLEFR
jgi:integrase